MSAGTTGLVLLPWRRLPGRAGPHYAPKAARTTGCAAWVNHSLRDMNPLLMTGFVGRLHTTICSSRPSVRERSEHDNQ